MMSCSHVVWPAGAAVVVVDEPGFVVGVFAFVVDDAPAVVVGSAADRATIGAVAIVRLAALPEVDVSAAGFVVEEPLTAALVVVGPVPVPAPPSTE